MGSVMDDQERPWEQAEREQRRRTEPMDITYEEIQGWITRLRELNDAQLGRLPEFLTHALAASKEFEQMAKKQGFVARGGGRR